jgi:amino acid permease
MIGGCMRILPPHQWTPMNKLSVILLFVFVLGLVAFATWQLFAGNLAASFSTFPFLLIIYLFVLKLRRREE